MNKILAIAVTVVITALVLTACSADGPSGESAAAVPVPPDEGGYAEASPGGFDELPPHARDSHESGGSQ